MTANVTFAIDSKDDVLTVPVEAVKARGGSSSVLIPNPHPDEDPIEKTVETGLSDGKKIEIAKGLSEGDVVLVPEFKLGGPKKNANPFAPNLPTGKKRPPGGPR
jgi:hypothetical protein